MNRTPVADWQQLSTLYEQADALEPDPLGTWLEELRAQRHPLLPQLEQMLAARSQVRHNGFLDTRPRLSLRSEPGPTAWANGSGIGPYRLLRKIGSGGMAEVWLAQRNDGAFQRRVAIKLLFRNPGSSERDTFAQRFDRERDILASLNHPNIAGLHDAGVTPTGQPWLALEYVEGQTLTTWCDERKQGVEARVRLFRQVLLAVQHAHANLVIHRDLKPGNILVTAEGEVRLLDFGIAKLMEPEGGVSVETELTRMAGRPMTPQYAAPEQLLGQPLTTACDVYSLGVVLYELLCGERPYELKTQSAAQLEQAILETEPRAPSRRPVTAAIATARGTTGAMLHRQLGSDLDAIVLRALAKQPAQRYSSAEAMRADLDRWLAGEPVEARAPSTAYRMGKFVRRHAIGVSLGLGAIVALVSVAALAVVLGLQARQESARAVAARDFMMGMFKQADADKSRGGDVTARELLDRGRDNVMRRLGSQPELQVDLLRGIAAIQVDMQEFGKADASLDQLAKLLVSIEQPKKAALAIASRAENALQSGNGELAESLVAEARRISGATKLDDELAVRLSSTKGWLAFKKGDAEQAKRLFVDALSRADNAFGRQDPRALDALLGLVRVEVALRDFGAALKAQEEVEARSASGGSLTAKERAQLDVSRAELLNLAGRYRQAVTHDRAAIERCLTALGRDDVLCQRLTLSRASAMVNRGAYEEASSDLPTLLALVRDSGSQEARVAAFILSARIQSMSGRSVAATSSLDQLHALALVRQVGQTSVAWKLPVFQALAEVAFQAGRLTDSEQWLERFAEASKQSGVSWQTNPNTASVQTLSGMILLSRGQSVEALRALQQAKVMQGQRYGPDHAKTMLCSLNEAQALLRLGRRGEALALIYGAQFVLREAFGADAPVYQRIERLRASAEVVDSLSRDWAARQTQIPQSNSSTLPLLDYFN